ncbi:MAG: hypothetical protein QM489_00230 [Candidatus Izemoplasma sp.]
MEKYDVIIIGGGLGSLTTAVYLSKRLRNIALFEQDKKKKLQKYTKKIKDSKNFTYEFKYYNYDVGGVHRGDLFNDYLRRCGLETNFEYYHNEKVTIFNKDKKTFVRTNNFDDFLTYLVRYYPKHRDSLHKFFDDVLVHHKNYIIQKKNRLSSDEYTLTSLLIEWGDLSLKQVLDKYFDNESLQNEFTLMYDSVGIPIDEISSYNYFIKWFDTFIEGSHFIKTSYDEIVKTFSKEISKQKEKIFTNRDIKEFKVENNVIKSIIDAEGNEIFAKHFVINMRIDDFVDQYMPHRKDIKEKFYSMYPTIGNKRYINQLYLGVDKDPVKLGIKSNRYIFSEAKDDEVRLLNLVNYKAIDSKACADGKGAILVEFLDDESPRKAKLNQVIDTLTKYFPKLIDNINVSRLGTKVEYFSGISSSDFWENKTVNDLFDIDDYRELNPFTNSYFIGKFVKPEAGITGIIQTGVEYGDAIDDLIYHGDDEEYFITHDVLMNIISHQFLANTLGKREKNIQFFIGKESYFIRTKAKHQRLFKGVSDISDLIIIVTNDCLYDLSVGNITLQDAIKSGAFEYVGDKEFLDDVAFAFDFGQKVFKSPKYSYIQGRQGIKYMLGVISVWALFLLASNFVDYLIISPIFLIGLGVLTYFKYRTLKAINVFDYFSIGVMLAVFIVSIFVSDFNKLHNSFYGEIVISLYWLGTWIINKPVAFDYTKFDYRTDYTTTKLFKTMSGGLTFIWGGLFLIIAGTNVLTGQEYSALGYYLIIFGYYLTYFYPNLYIKGNINK